MATITAANVQALCDSIAKHVSDLQAALANVATLQSGLQSTLAKVAGLPDPTQVALLTPAFNAFAARESALLANALPYGAILDSVAPAVAALDNVTSGLGAFCLANSLQVHNSVADAHMRAVGMGLIHSSRALPPSVAFPPAVDPMGTFTASGAGAGAFAKSGIVSAQYGNAPLQAYNAGAGATGAAAGTYTVTYSAYNASGKLVTGLTTTVSVPGATASAATIAMTGISGVAVTNITLSGGQAGDKIAIRALSVRSVTY